MKGLFSSRKFRQGTIATAITAVVVALVVVVNLVVTTLTQQYGLTLDLTPSKLFSITDETKAYLSGIEKDVVIYVLNTEENFTAAGEQNHQAAEVLKKFSLASDHIHIEFIDFMANPAFAQQYPTLQLSTSSILVTCGEKVRDLTPYQLYDIQSNEYGQAQFTASKAEQVLTSAVLAVTSDQTVNIAVISGHNEEVSANLTTLLNDNNYLTSDVNLTTAALDSQYTAALLIGPRRDLTEEELKKLDDFLANDGQYGRSLFYFASSEAASLPNLEAFLADWGIGYQPGMVYESDASRYVSTPYLALVDYGESTYSETVQAAGLLALTAFARPMEALFESKGGIDTQTLLQFADTAGVVLEQDQVLEPDGIIPHAILSQITAYEGTELRQSQVAAFGSSSFLDPSFLGNPNCANSEYLLDLFAQLSGRTENPVNIQSKPLAGATMSLNFLHVVILGVLLVIVIPVGVLITGLVIWGRRRHR